MSCTYTTDELWNRHENIEEELESVRNQLARSRPAMGLPGRKEELQRELSQVRNLLEARGEL